MRKIVICYLVMLLFILTACGRQIETGYALERIEPIENNVSATNIISNVDNNYDESQIFTWSMQYVKDWVDYELPELDKEYELKLGANDLKFSTLNVRKIALLGEHGYSFTSALTTERVEEWKNYTEKKLHKQIAIVFYDNREHANIKIEVGTHVYDLDKPFGDAPILGVKISRLDREVDVDDIVQINGLSLNSTKEDVYEEMGTPNYICNGLENTLVYVKQGVTFDFVFDTDWKLQEIIMVRK